MNLQRVVLIILYIGILQKKIQDAMGSSQTNKWVMDQVVDIDAVEMCKKFIEVYSSLTK